MKKKLLKFLFLSLGICSIFFVFTACTPSKQHTHEYDSGKITKIATCTEKGELSFTCSCGHFYTEETPKLQHNYVNGVCAECKAFDEEYCEDLYNKLCAEMLTMENKVQSFNTIETYLSSLPTNYRDVSAIKNEFLFLKTQHDVFTDAQFRNIMKLIIADKTSEDYKENYVDSNKVRQAYFNLIDNKDIYPKWNVINIADNYIYSGDNNGILLYVFVGLWKDDEGNYINIIENEDNSISFASNLPNEKQDDENYFYYIDNRIIGYQPQSDVENKIPAYRIIEIKNDYIKVFCFKNNSYYTLFNA